MKLDGLDLQEAWVQSDPSARWRLNLVLSQKNGAEESALIYFELDPGCRLPRHTDSAEEVLFVLAGSAVSKLGDEELTMDAPAILRIPAEQPHELRNAGSTAVRAVGFFATATPVSTFDDPVLPEGTTVRGIER